MKRPDAEPISDITKYNRSFVESFGYKCELREKNDDPMEDLFSIHEGTYTLGVKRKNFFRFISQRHPVVHGQVPMFSVFEFCNWFNSYDSSI